MASKEPAMNGTIVMTGASRGIGRVAAERILREWPDVHLLVVARGSSGARLSAELSAGGRTVSYVAADLGSLESVRSAATEIRDRLNSGDLPPLRGFVGNAGMQYTNALTEGPDGFEATFAVNVLANHVFVRLLEDCFAFPARIVITVSDTHFGDFKHNMGMVPGPAWRSPDVLARTGAFPKPDTTTGGRTAYSTSKLAAIYLVHEYARRLPAGIDVVAYNPGFVPGTDLARNADPVSRFAMRRIMPAMTLTPFATSRSAAGRYLADVVLGTTKAPTGSYVDRGRVVRSSDESYDPLREGELWDAAERFTTAHPA
ncbi:MULTISPECIES: SDR family NAD(P)-dependent oxidoreductase [unclassified Micromonospora]|uniref:SDR family NAD(P)-dependent oxidoreductase n=1 Tax=Micromonospora sp. NPDC005206 TaxID=3157022 RepID=UPI0033AEE86D